LACFNRTIHLAGVRRLISPLQVGVIGRRTELVLVPFGRDRMRLSRRTNLQWAKYSWCQIHANGFGVARPRWSFRVLQTASLKRIIFLRSVLKSARPIQLGKGNMPKKNAFGRMLTPRLGNIWPK
jgi:hypothetical protein